jgi:hypothetical protein
VGRTIAFVSGLLLVSYNHATTTHRSVFHSCLFITLQEMTTGAQQKIGRDVRSQFYDGGNPLSMTPYAGAYARTRPSVVLRQHYQSLAVARPLPGGSAGAGAAPANLLAVGPHRGAALLLPTRLVGAAVGPSSSRGRFPVQGVESRQRCLYRGPGGPATTSVVCVRGAASASFAGWAPVPRQAAFPAAVHTASAAAVPAAPTSAASKY